MKLYHLRRPSKSFQAGCNFAEISSSLKWERSTEEIKRNWLCAQFDAGEKRPEPWYLEFIFHLIAKLPAVCSIFAPSLLPVTELKCPLHLADFTRDAVDKFFRSLVPKREKSVDKKEKSSKLYLRNVEITRISNYIESKRSLFINSANRM